MKKKGDLQFDSYAYDGDYHGFARNTAGDTVAHVTVSDVPTYDDEGWWDEGSEQKVSWAMANKEGRVRAGPHMLLALMKQHYDLDPVADDDLSHEGAMMARSAARRGLIRGHSNNPDMRTSIGPIAGGSSEVVQGMMEAAHGDFSVEDAVRVDAGELSRRVSFNTGQREQAKETLFRNRRKTD